jgi:aspartate/tyrosine/aromatic aminotransferase
VAEGPADPILSLAVRYNADTFENKVNLGVGAYRDNDGKPYIFPVVKKAEEIIVADKSLDKEYSPIDGNQEFNRGARGVLFGFDHKDVTSTRVATAQTLSGSGALRLIGEFLKTFRPGPVYLSDPTWGNHPKIFELLGTETRQYRYFDKNTKGLDFDGMIEDLKNA